LLQLAKREQRKEQIVQLKEKGVELPTGIYSCLVVDPPWPMQKIEREVRPNQVEFDYPTMTEDELKAFPLLDLAADDCHLYLWTTQKHVPLALRLAEHWGFKYQCLMTWVKNVGFTPFSWMYSTEHVLFCTRGNLPLLAIGKRLDFSAKVREHSRKPDEFYDLVKEVSPGPRLDVFSREKRDGFEQYGNEVEKYVSVR
jgi:N6-adenosine-specific RNA methylase IME4